MAMKLKNLSAARGIVNRVRVSTLLDGTSNKLEFDWQYLVEKVHQ